HTGQQKQTITQPISRIIHPIIVPKTQQPPAEPKSPLAAADEQGYTETDPTRQHLKRHVDDRGR
ncbi:hypothetical protein, partial [Methylobacterium sp. W2]|uniref:hypothetical protein n=1 Tax=Methylobacterium sp. W2 TaxID=2598107 RepID=UPI001D0C91C6